MTSGTAQQSGDALHGSEKQQTTTYSTKQYGVWEVLLMDESHWEQCRRLIYDAPKSIPVLYQLVQDIYSLSPTLFALFMLSQLWMSCQEAVKMHFSSQVLRMIEQCLRRGAPDWAGVMYILSLRLATSGFATFLSWYSDQILDKLQRRITSHFQLRIMNAKLKRDLARSGSPAEQINISASEAWESFRALLHVASLSLRILGQLTLIVHLSHRDSGGLLFAVLTVLQPAFSVLISRDIWTKVCIVKKNNKDDLRMQALAGLTEPEYRQDVISNNLQQFIVTEYQRANERLGDLTETPVWELGRKHMAPFLPVLLTLVGDLPMVYCAILALLSPKQTSFASIVILQESSSMLVQYVDVIVHGTEHFRKSLKTIRELYESTTEDAGEQGNDGAYQEKPSQLVVAEDATLRKGQGIEFELRNVSFSYPGSQTNQAALSNIDLKIRSGQFVVLVGANGSGKSTLLKLLLCLYQPTPSTATEEGSAQCQSTSGQIYIDSLPSSSYSESSLRRSMAVLSQDNLIYPGFSLGENIGFGFTPLLSDTEALRVSARKAGAEEVLARMKHGADTVLDPLQDYYQFNVRDQDEDHPLKKVLEELRRPVELSGGEKQRIVAARTFMRFNSGEIRFLAVDEPSSALDAEGEELLLDNLLEEREGKTIIFVTHRFGKLTKQADMIICMKEGRIVERGSHQELMKVNGEYKKLYDIQASPFKDDETPPEM